MYVISPHGLGDVAQLGERVNGIHEVRGSIPLVSTEYLDRECGAGHRPPGVLHHQTVVVPSRNAALPAPSG